MFLLSFSKNLLNQYQEFLKIIFTVPSERWCRLRGNMLFYFKSSEAWSEPAGVVVLDIGNIHVDPIPVDGLWPFTLGKAIKVWCFSVFNEVK